MLVLEKLGTLCIIISSLVEGKKSIQWEFKKEAHFRQDYSKLTRMHSVFRDTPKQKTMLEADRSKIHFSDESTLFSKVMIQSLE